MPCCLCALGSGCPAYPAEWFLLRLPLRGKKDALKFEDYILPLVFIKRLSDVFEDEIARLSAAARIKDPLVLGGCQGVGSARLRRRRSRRLRAQVAVQRSPRHVERAAGRRPSHLLAELVGGGQ